MTYAYGMLCREHTNLLESNMTNIRTAAELKLALDAIVAELKALDAATIPDADLVPLVKSIQNVSAYASAIDAQIRERAIGNNIMLPGVTTKDSIKHRQWHDEAVAAELAQEQFGDDAFTHKLKSPAGIEKLGAAGKALVAIASYKPDADKTVAY